MQPAYKITNINSLKSEVNVELTYGEHTLVQSIVVKDLTDGDDIRASILKVLAKFKADIDTAIADVPVSQDIQDLVDQKVDVSADDLPTLDPADDEPLDNQAQSDDEDNADTDV